MEKAIQHNKTVDGWKQITTSPTVLDCSCKGSEFLPKNQAPSSLSLEPLRGARRSEVEGESRSPERKAHRAPLAAAVRSFMAGPSEAHREVRRSEVEGESRSPEKSVHRAPLAAAVRSFMAGGHKEAGTLLRSSTQKTREFRPCRKDEGKGPPHGQEENGAAPASSKDLEWWAPIIKAAQERGPSHAAGLKQNKRNEHTL